MNLSACKSSTLKWIGQLGALALLLAPEVLAEEPEVQQNSEWALEITEKEFDKDTGKLRVQITNTNDFLSVTAFGVAATYDRGGGRGGTRVRGEEMLLGEPLVPGAIFELTYNLSLREERERGNAKFAAVKAAVHYEILSDTTSRGNVVFIDEIFAKRAHFLREVEIQLTRLLTARRSSTSKSSLMEFWADESARRKEASDVLKKVNGRPSQTERYRSEAVFSLTDLSSQVQQRIAEGEPSEEILDKMEWVLRDHYLEPTSYGVRQQDLENIREVEEDGR